MFFSKKKFYTLLDIKNQIVYTPLIFVIILAFVSSFVIYFFLKYQESNEIKLLVQSESFYNKNLLESYIENVSTKTSESVDFEENDIIKYIYELKGYSKSFVVKSKKLDFELFKNYMYILENKNNVNFMLFNAITYKVLYGKNIISYLREQTNSKMNTEKFTNFMLRNIQYTGNDNMSYWIDNKKRKVRLSYFKFIDDEGLMLGVFSKVDDMRALTKKAILDSVVSFSKLKEKSHFIFYDGNENTVHNYYNKLNTISASNIDKLELLSEVEFIYSFPKYNYKIIVKNNFLKNEMKAIKIEHENRLLIGIFIVLLIAIILITTANIFGKFINGIFNRYNNRLERRNFLYKQWKDRYELAIIASNDGLWDINLDTNKIFFSNKWLEMFGYERDEIQTFDEWANLIHKDDKDKVLEEFEKHINLKSEHFICEYRLRDKYNNYKWILVRGKAFSEKSINRMLMMSMDIDNRMRLTKELRNVEILTEYGRIVIFRCLTDKDLSVQFVSKSINSYGYTADDFYNKKIGYFDFVYSPDRRQLRKAINKAISDNVNSFTSIYRVIDNKSEIKWVYNRSILIKDDNGKIIGLYGYLNDITKMKINEEELKQKIQEEHEKNIQKDRLLVQQNKLASMGEILGNIAHQWRQPLNNINLLMYFIRDNYGNFSKEELHESIKSAKVQIDYMSKTIDDFRNFYQPTKDKKTFNIKDAMTQSSKIVISSFERNSVTLEILGNDISIKNYQNEFEQVIVNILNNAVDAKIIKSKKDKFDAKVIITISKKNDLISISIFNNCGNIEEDVKERMFEPYFTTKFENQGTGIGLYMAKVIIEKNMKGNIEAFNKDDGIEFLITFKA